MVKESNQSDTHLVVRSLKVLSGISGAGIDTIKDNVQALQNSQQTLAQETKDYWTSIASDGIISPLEKKTLSKEWETIKSEEASLIQEAETAGITTGYTVYDSYTAAYAALYAELVTTLKLFDSMETSTELEDRTAFNTLYETYYAKRDALRSAIYGTNSASTYNLDLTPEMQAAAALSDGSWRDTSASVYITVNLYKGADGIDYAVSRTAYYNGEAIGTWDGNTVTIPISSLKNDTNYITVTVQTADSLQLSAKATVAKIYQGEDGDWRQYDMLLSDNAVKSSDDGMNPETITAKKIMRNASWERETNYGKITVSADGGEETETGGYTKDETGAYQEGKDYYQKFSPYLLMLDKETALELSADTAAVFYEKETE